MVFQKFGNFVKCLVTEVKLRVDLLKVLACLVFVKVARFLLGDLLNELLVLEESRKLHSSVCVVLAGKQEPELKDLSGPLTRLHRLIDPLFVAVRHVVQDLNSSFSLVSDIKAFSA